jgi:hypothetical protein
VGPANSRKNGWGLLHNGDLAHADDYSRPAVLSHLAGEVLSRGLDEGDRLVVTDLKTARSRWSQDQAEDAGEQLLRAATGAARNEHGPRGRKSPREGENTNATAQIVIYERPLASQIAAKTAAWQQGD